MTTHDSYGERWLDREAGPVVRPYALTSGRTAPVSGAMIGLIDIVVATGERPPPRFRAGPEYRRILSTCRLPTPVVDVASEIDLPIGVVRVLLGDLINEALLRVLQAQRQPRTDQQLLRMVLNGLESL